MKLANKRLYIHAKTHSKTGKKRISSRVSHASLLNFVSLKSKKKKR